MNILLLASHSVAEYDDIRMFTDLGYDVFCPGGYQVPSRPGESLRPALPDAPHHPDLVAACEDVRFVQGLGDPGPYIDWAKARLHDKLIDWADVIICHHFPERWIKGQWERIKHKRVIWRTCGQSDPRLEEAMMPLTLLDGLQVVRYSPNEKKAFEHAGAFAGQDAVIRFGKYPEDYSPFSGDYPFYVGDWPVIGNITQDMVKRGKSVGIDRWWSDVGQMLTKPAGPGSEELPGGMGPLSYEEMLVYLRRIRVYLYLGTMPASYTLGLIEAMMSGVPVVTHSWSAGFDEHWLNLLWEADDIVGRTAKSGLGIYLEHKELAEQDGQIVRQRALDLFDVRKVGRQWVDFLGAP